MIMTEDIIEKRTKLEAAIDMLLRESEQSKYGIHIVAATAYKRVAHARAQLLRTLAEEENRKRSRRDG